MINRPPSAVPQHQLATRNCPRAHVTRSTFRRSVCCRRSCGFDFSFFSDCSVCLVLKRYPKECWGDCHGLDRAYCPRCPSLVLLESNMHCSSC